MHRAAVEIPAVLQVGKREVACTVRDVSTQGVALVLKESLAPGMVVRVAFRLPNSRTLVEAAGVLARSARQGEEAHVGLRLVEVDADALRVLEAFVAQNRSDRPFSDDRPARASQPAADRGGTGDALAGLYQEAVSEVDGKKSKPRGLFGWLRRRE